MAATPSVKIIKSFSYKGSTRLWSNRYHFNGGTPADTTHWNTLFDAVTAAEKALWNSQCTIVEAIGYAAGSEVPVASKAYSLAGTTSMTTCTGGQAPGDAAALLRWSTAARTSKNHPVYLFNYYHCAFQGSGPDDLCSVQKSAIDTYANSWVSPGFSDGTNSYVRAGPNGATATGHLTESELTHRDFPR